MTSLLDLPFELLILLPRFLRNIEDFTALASTCRSLRRACNEASPSTILRLAAASAPIFVPPHPWYLVAATARRLATWVVADPVVREPLLCSALEKGIDGLYDLCLEHSGLTLSEIRRHHLLRFDVVNPLTDRLDKIAGKQWYAQPNFWDGGASDAATIYCEPERAGFQIIIYGELFGVCTERWLAARGDQPPPLTPTTRLAYIMYCVPDWRCEDGEHQLARKASGPYETRHSGPVGDEEAINFIMRTRKWSAMWKPVYRSVGPEFDQAWREKLWRDALHSLGFRGMELILKPGVLESREAQTQLKALHHQIADLPESARPKWYTWGTNKTPVSMVPSLYDDIFVPLDWTFSGSVRQDRYTAVPP